MSFKRRLFKNVFTVGGYIYITRIITFISSAITSRLLLPKEYGYVALITVFTGFIAVFSDAGLSYAIIRSDYKTQYQQGLKTITFYLGISLFFIMVLLSYPIALFYSDLNLILPIIVFSIYFIFSSMAIVPTAILSKSLKFDVLGKRTLFVTLLSIVITISLAYLGFSYWSLIIAQVFSALGGYLLVESQVKLGLKIYSRAHVKVAYRHSKSLIKNIVGFNIINYWARNSDNLIVGKFYGSADLGVYNRAYTFMMLPISLISGVFSNILFPSLKKHLQEGGDINKEYENVLGFISLLNYPVAAVMVLFPKPLVILLWGENWKMVAEILPYFGLILLMQGLITTIGNIFILYGAEKANFRIGFLNAVILIGCIAAGAFFSVLDIARFYSLGFIIINIPINIYYGFIKIFGFDSSHIIRFWMPKVVLSLLTLIFIWLEIHSVVVVLVLFYGLHLVLLQKHDISKFLQLVKKRNIKSFNKY